MQKIHLKKLVDLNHDLKELQSISVDESIHYKLEQNGMRALGHILIKGDYRCEDEIKKFDDMIELDLFAHFDKIVDRREFVVKVDDFDYAILDGNLNMSIEASVHGVKDDYERVVDTIDYASEVESLMRSKDETIMEEKMPDTILKPVDDKVEYDDNDSDIGAYYFYVIKEDDTYLSIAKHYNVNEDDLREYNHNKELEKGHIIIVPYGL